MNIKNDLTNFIIEKLNLENKSKKHFATWKHLIWKNPRNNIKGSLGLTEKGFDLLSQTDIKFYNVKLDSNLITFENKFVLWLDRSFQYPHFLSKTKIFFFEQRAAVELALFCGDLKKYYHYRNNCAVNCRVS